MLGKNVTKFSLIPSRLSNVKAHSKVWDNFLAIESPLKMMKDAFYFTLKALFVLKILSFCLDFLVMYKNGMIRKIRSISRLMTSQPG